MKNAIRVLYACVAVGLAACYMPSGKPEAPEALATAAVPSASAQIQPGAATSTTAPPTATSTPASPPTLTPSATPNVPTALFLMNANCRSGPLKTKDALYSFLKGDSTQIFGRNNDLSNTWWLVKIPGSNVKCWVSTITAQVIGSYDDIPTIPPPY